MATHTAGAAPPAPKKKPRYHLGQPGDSKDIIGDPGARFHTKIAKGDPVFSLPVGRPVDALVRIAPTMLVCAISDFEADLWAGALQIWKTPSDKEQKSRLLSGVKFQCGVSALASASETCLLAGLDDGDMQIVNVNVGDEILEKRQWLSHHDDAVTAIKAIQGCKTGLFVSGSSDCSLRIWDIHHKKDCVMEFFGHDAAVQGVCGRENVVLSASMDRSIRMWDLRKGAMAMRVRLDIGASSLDVHPSQPTVAAGLQSGAVALIDLRKPSQEMACKTQHVGPVHALAFDSGSQLLSGGDDGVVTLMDLAPSTGFRKRWQAHGDYVRSVGFGDGGLALTGSWDRSVCAWRL